MLVRKCAKRRLEVEIKKVRDYEDHVALLRHVREVVRDARDLRRRAARLGEQKLTYDVQQMMTTLLRRDELADPVREQDQAHAVVVVERGHGKQRGDVRGELAFGEAAGAEPRARGDVDREIDVELALLAVFLDVRDVHAGGHVPVDGADIVTRLVLADLFEVEPRSTKHASVRPDERLVREDPRLDLDLLDHAEDLRWDVPLPRRRMKHGGHYGTATLSRTRPMTISGVISSASAS